MFLCNSLMPVTLPVRNCPLPFCLFDYVAFLFFTVTDRRRILIPNAIFNRILITLAKWPLVSKCSKCCNAPLDPKLCRVTQTYPKQARCRAPSENLSSPVTLIRGNRWVFFWRIRPCHFLAAFVSPPAASDKLNVIPLLFRWQILYAILWGCAPLSGPSSNLHAKVVNHGLVVHAEGRQPGMPIIHNKTCFIYGTRGKERGSFLLLHKLHIFHL